MNVGDKPVEPKYQTCAKCGHDTFKYVRCAETKAKLTVCIKCGERVT